MSTDAQPWPGVTRPQRADARRNFDALLAAARESFAELGTDASLELIARRANVGIGTLYRNFPTREMLIEAVYVADVERAIASAVVPPGIEPWTALRGYLEAFLESVGTKHALIAALNRESAVLSSSRAAMYAAGEPLLRRAQAAGQVRPELSIDDVLRLLSGVAGVAFPDEAQRQRVLTVAVEGLRTSLQPDRSR